MPCSFATPTCAIWPGYAIDRVRMQGYALADRQIEVGLCSLAVPVLPRHGQVVAALNVGVPAATVSAALKESLARYAARRNGPVATAIAPSAASSPWRAAPDPGGQQQKHDPLSPAPDCAHGVGAFAAAISASATPAGSAWVRLTASPIDDDARCAMVSFSPDGSTQ